MNLLASAIAVTVIIGFSAASYGQEWKLIGPDPIGGQGFSNLPNATASGVVDGIAIDPSGRRDSTIYVATVAGGIWKTVDGGTSWSSKDDSMSVLFMGAVALDPSNSSTVYAGIGGPYCCFSGGGVYRSTDGADHWKLLNPKGIFTGNAINAIVLPKSDTLLVATGDGLYKSIDGGQDFGNNSPKFDNGQPISIQAPKGARTNGNISEVDTSNPATVYAAVDGFGRRLWNVFSGVGQAVQLRQLSIQYFGLQRYLYQVCPVNTAEQQGFLRLPMRWNVIRRKEIDRRAMRASQVGEWRKLVGQYQPDQHQRQSAGL
jgi:hypothetical protein